MTDDILLTIGEDGTASLYDDTYDITIHCESREEQDKVKRILQNPEPHWIPVEQALPDEPFGCFVTVMDTNPVTMEEFENILPYFVGWDGEQWNDADGEQCPFEVLAWWMLPEPYKGVTE